MYIYTNHEIVDMHFIYSAADWKALETRQLYRERIPTRHLTDRKTWTLASASWRNRFVCLRVGQHWTYQERDYTGTWRTCVSWIWGATGDKHVSCIHYHKGKPDDGLESIRSRRPSTLSCTACTCLESNHPSATRWYFMMVLPTVRCATRFWHTRAIHLDAVSIAKAFSLLAIHINGHTRT